MNLYEMKESLNLIQEYSSNHDDNLIKQFMGFCGGSKEILVFGAGNTGELVIDYLKNNKIQISSILTTHKENDYFMGITVRSIDDYSDYEKYKVVLAVASKNREECIKILEKKGIEYFYSDKLLFMLFKNRFDSYNYISLRKQVDSLSFAEIINSGSYIYIVCPASIGDTLYVCSLIKALKKKEKKKIAVIVKDNHKDVANCFSSIDDVIVSKDIVCDMVRFSVYTQIWRTESYIYGHFHIDSKTGKSIDDIFSGRGKEDILFRYKKHVLGITEKAQFELPIFPELNDLSFTDKYVVIFPYALTEKMLPISLWEKLVIYIKNMGIEVYTNVGNENEKPIKNSKKLHKDVISTARICEKASFVISIRNGMCDILSFTSANIFVVNTTYDMVEKWDLEKNKTEDRAGILKNINICSCDSEENIISNIMSEINISFLNEDV